jgi:hypothetical protein
MLETFIVEAEMKVGDLVKLLDTFITVDFVQMPQKKIAMIIEGPNEVGNVKVLLPDASTRWVHCSDLEYFPRDVKGYLKK